MACRHSHTGATAHISNNEGILDISKPYIRSKYVKVGNGKILDILHKGIKKSVGKNNKIWKAY